MTEEVFLEEVSSKQINREKLKDNDQLSQTGTKVAKCNCTKARQQHSELKPDFTPDFTRSLPSFPPLSKCKGALQNCTM